ncbi:alpha/beta fold hydrolase [Aliivibrio salmonicida]|uniref:alpha/beta fold hydrolase n=1 Tax=Aliivibrio salmonicida TaxID=40269 RepID=UPI00406C131C
MLKHSEPAFYLDGIQYQSHYFSLPLNYDDYTATPDHVSVYMRELVKTENKDRDLPYLVYFQGGPGFPAMRPCSNSGWLKRALDQYRVILLDQRGTGLSSPITIQTIGHLDPKQQAQYLSYFRADNIVRDAEAIRKYLNVDKWAIIGQSFGGFCSLTYLSIFPESLLASYITGGIPSITRHIDDVYYATYQRTLDKNSEFFARFPRAQELCNRIADALLDNKTTLPNGQIFTVEQFQQMGICFGMAGGPEELYFQLETAFVDVNGKQELNYGFLNYVLGQQAHLTNPLYAILHESIYCQHNASNWSAQRVRASYSEFSYQKGASLRFTGEMVYPWFFDQLETLKPLKEAAEMLAAKSDWPNLYDIEQLAKNTVPVAAATYVNDMFVEFDFSRETLRSIPNSRAWMSSEYEHNGLRVDGEKILSILISMTEDIKAIQ